MKKVDTVLAVIASIAVFVGAVVIPIFEIALTPNLPMWLQQVLGFVAGGVGGMVTVKYIELLWDIQ